MKKFIQKMIASVLTAALVFGMFAGTGTLVADASDVTNPTTLNIKVVDGEGNPVSGVKLYLESQYYGSHGSKQINTATNEDGKTQYTCDNMEPDDDEYIIKPAEDSSYTSESGPTVVFGTDSSWNTYIDTVDGNTYTGQDVVVTVQKKAPEPSITSVSAAKTSVSKDGEELEITITGENLPEKFYYLRKYVAPGEYGGTTDSNVEWSGKEATATGSSTEKVIKVPLPAVSSYPNAIEWKVQVGLTSSGSWKTVSGIKIDGVEAPKTPVITEVTLSKTSVSAEGETITATIKGENLEDTVYCQLYYHYQMGASYADSKYGVATQVTGGSDTEKTYEVEIPAQSDAGRDIIGWKVGAALSMYGTYTKSEVIKIAETPVDPVKEETKTALDTAIKEASEAKEADYTAESWKAYKDAVDAANALVTKEGATETEYQDAIKAINEAKEKLVKAEASQKPSVTQDVKVTKITLSGISKKIAAGKKVQLAANVAPANAANKAVTWTTSNKKYATVTANGKVTVKKAGAGKTVTITATAKDGSGVKATYKIKIMKDTVKKISLKAKKTVKAGKKVAVKATVKTTGKKANKTLKWTSSNTKYATVNSKGKVTTKKAGKGKKVKITAKATDGSNKKKTVTIKIK